MPLSQLYEQIQNDEWIDLPTGWLQGRTVFGGLIAAILMKKAFLTVSDPEKKVLSCSITFVGPVQLAKVRLTAEILRQGKSVTSIEVRLWQDEAVQSILIASFGSERQTHIKVSNEKNAPDFPEINHLKIVPKNLPFPECFKQFQLIWAEGTYPVSGSKQPDFGGWSRFDPDLHENRKMQIPDLLALMDVWPPGVLPLFKIPAPSSSLTWHISFVHPLQQNMQDWFKYKVFTDYADHGYSTEHAYLWDENNRLIAISRQTVTVFT